MKNFELGLPLKDIIVTQKFGKNFLYYDKTKNKVIDLYPSLGLKGHNGLDLKCKIGCRLLSAHDGIVTYVGEDGLGGKMISICTSKTGGGYKSLYGHLSEFNVKQGQPIKRGVIIGRAGNTGGISTGPHLHFELKEIVDMRTVNYSNGYKGALNPADFFKENWDKPNAYHRYGRKQKWLAEFNMRFKNFWIHRQMIARGRHPLSLTTAETNALVYGGWDFESVMNDAMFEIWGFVKKTEYTEDKIIPFLRA